MWKTLEVTPLGNSTDDAEKLMTDEWAEGLELVWCSEFLDNGSEANIWAY
jgi:hypothetical protein